MKQILLPLALLCTLSVRAQKAEDYPFMTIGGRIGLIAVKQPEIKRYVPSSYSFDFITGFEDYSWFGEFTAGYNGSPVVSISAGASFHLGEDIRIQPLLGVSTQDMFVGLRIHIGEFFIQANAGTTTRQAVIGFRGPIFER